MPARARIEPSRLMGSALSELDRASAVAGRPVTPDTPATRLVPSTSEMSGVVTGPIEVAATTGSGIEAGWTRGLTAGLITPPGIGGAVTWEIIVGPTVGPPGVIV